MSKINNDFLSKIEMIKDLKENNEKLYINFEKLYKGLCEVEESRFDDSLTDLKFYAKHDFKHAKRVLIHADEIYKALKFQKKRLNELEIFILACSSLLHDIGLFPVTTSKYRDKIANWEWLKENDIKWNEEKRNEEIEKNWIRENHGIISCYSIMETNMLSNLEFGSKFTPGEKEFCEKLIGLMVLYHQSSTPLKKEHLETIAKTSAPLLFKPLNEFKIDKIASAELNHGNFDKTKVASILRIADGSDIHYQRISGFTRLRLKLYDNIYNEINNLKHFVSKEAIEKLEELQKRIDREEEQRAIDRTTQVEYVYRNDIEKILSEVNVDIKKPKITDILEKITENENQISKHYMKHWNVEKTEILPDFSLKATLRFPCNYEEYESIRKFIENDYQKELDRADLDKLMEQDKKLLFTDPPIIIVNKDTINNDILDDYKDFNSNIWKAMIENKKYYQYIVSGATYSTAKIYQIINSLEIKIKNYGLLENKNFSIFVSGSMARWEAHNESNVDFFAIVDKEDKGLVQKLENLIEEMNSELKNNTFLHNIFSSKVFSFSDKFFDFGNPESKLISIIKTVVILFESYCLWNSDLFNKNIKEVFSKIKINKEELLTILKRDILKYYITSWTIFEHEYRHDPKEDWSNIWKRYRLQNSRKLVTLSALMKIELLKLEDGKDQFIQSLKYPPIAFLLKKDLISKSVKAYLTKNMLSSYEEYLKYKKLIDSNDPKLNPQILIKNAEKVTNSSLELLASIWGTQEETCPNCEIFKEITLFVW
ncbi:MAG: HD domain-containing protein [Candidatus Heimdallarchaeaceae archaeon]